MSLGDKLLSPEEERVLRRIREWQEIEVKPKDLKKQIKGMKKPVAAKIRERLSR